MKSLLYLTNLIKNILNLIKFGSYCHDNIKIESMEKIRYSKRIHYENYGN